MAGITTAPSLIAASSVSHSGDFVAEHQQHAVAASCAELAQEVGDLRFERADSSANEPDRLVAVLVDDVQRRRLVAARHRIEVVERPVEVVERRPPERPKGRFIVGAMLQAEIACIAETPGPIG